MAIVEAEGNHRGWFGVSRRVSGALLLLLMLAVLSMGCGGGNEGGGDGNEGGDAADRGGGGGGGGGEAEGPPITELSEIVSASDRAELAGRRVRIPEVNVLEVVNNRGLFVGADEEERLFVAVRRTPRVGGTTGGPEEDQQGRQRFEEGQTLELAGVIRPVPETADEALRRFGLEGEQFELVQEEEVFIRANRAEVVGGG